ncbi:MAG: hypothetical protein ABI904_20395 [Chloroflexota bacterium]
MTQPASNNKEPSKLNKLLTGKDDQPSIQSRLPRAAGASTPLPKTPSPAPSPVSSAKPATSSKPQSERSYSKVMSTFWTIASVISLLVNIGTVIALIVVVQLLGGTKATLAFAQGQANGLLGGLYNNFVKMDAASIKTTIHVEKEIPVQFSLNVSGPTDVVLSRDVVINGALVTVNTGGLNINRASANIVLPAGTVLPVTIQNLVVPVDQKVLAVLDVPVNIPLNQTELHDPFVGLQKVVEPYYCLLQPKTVVNGVNVCATSPSILPFTIATPQGTVIP